MVRQGYRIIPCLSNDPIYFPWEDNVLTVPVVYAYSLCTWSRQIFARQPNDHLLPFILLQEVRDLVR